MATRTPQDLDRNLALDLVRVTEAAAMAAGRWVGRGDKEGGDGAAVDAMRKLINSLPMAGTVVIGTAIAVGNIVVPVIIRRDVPWRRIPTVTAAYTAALNVGSMITALGTAPLAAAVGWRWALVAWGALTVVALVFWLVVARRRTGTPPAASTPAEPSTATGTAIRSTGRT